MKKNRLVVVLVNLLFTVVLFAQNTIGNATYYSNRLHGRKASDGSLYHKDSLTCAHRSLPFGTTLKVRNPRNGHEVIVKVTDRGPYRKGAIVDLSWEAARQLDILVAGVSRVEIAQVDGLRMPFRAKDRQDIPDFRLEDRETGAFYSIAEWNQKQKLAKSGNALAQNLPARINKQVYKKDSVPRWRIVREKLSASADAGDGDNFKYVNRFSAQGKSVK